MSQSGQQPLAQVIVHKIKDCPTLSTGRITPEVLQLWYHACKRFKKHSGKTEQEVVPLVADATLEPRLQRWYQADAARIDALSLQKYIDELAAYVLEPNWAHNMRMRILSSKQPDATPFVDWKIELETWNSTLSVAAPTFAVSDANLRNHLEANLRPRLSTSLVNEPLVGTLTTLHDWSSAVNLRDNRLRAQEGELQTLLGPRATVKKPSLASRISESPSLTSLTTPRRSNNATADKPALPKLSEAERTLLDNHQGCTRCRRFYVSHTHASCPLKATNSWPDAETYKPLTIEMANAAKAAPRLAAGFAGTQTYEDEEAVDFGGDYTDDQQ